MSTQISKKRKFVADGVFRAELNEFFTRELAEEGYSGCDVRVTHARTEVPAPVKLFCQLANNLFADYYPCYTHSRGSWREGPPHQGVDCSRSEAFQVPRELPRALR